ncbi:hypothetical protein HJC23_013218 [Cyclotella cryptica]|uniref:Uncharacterized protein n=1 Tax=Cyclotella cryptica TaxID=29204 RepID=A0ABD3QCU5_9STRA
MMVTPTNKESKQLYPELRAKAVGKLPPETVNSIRALIVTNREILDRCMESKADLCDPRYGFACNRKVFNDVKCRNISGYTEFLVFPEDKQKTFDITPLARLSGGLDFLQPTFVSGCIDFNALFETSLLLHDDIVLPYLVKLKEHLELVQVCLGMVDEWLMESRDNKNFLEDIFSTKLDYHKNEEFCKSNCDNIVCSNCGESYEKHRIELLSKGKVCRRSGFQPLTQFSPVHLVLKRIRMDGKLEASFNLSNEEDRVKLIKCLEFAQAMEKWG